MLTVLGMMVFPTRAVWPFQLRDDNRWPHRVYPHFAPMPLAYLHAPFDHPDWIFELKMDGFRALAYVERGNARLMSRRGNVFKSFPTMAADLGAALTVSDSVLDGELSFLTPRAYPSSTT